MVAAIVVTIVKAEVAKVEIVAVMVTRADIIKKEDVIHIVLRHLLQIVSRVQTIITVIADHRNVTTTILSTINWLNAINKGGALCPVFIYSY
ncbi:hypothetical protein D3C76_1398400 [compost metagenome]